MSEVLAIVPARSGSKAIAGKNLALLAGQPLIAWTLNAAAASQRINRTIVSTDSSTIADTARRLGGDVPFLRPAHLAADDTPMIPVLIHALDWLAEHESYKPDVLLLLQPTSPLRTSADIDGALEKLETENADAVVGVSAARTHPALARRIDERGRLVRFVDGLALPDRRQDAPAAYEINGAIYAVRVEVLRRRRSWYNDRTLGYVMPAERSVDIDEPMDLLLAEAMIRHGRGGES